MVSGSSAGSMPDSRKTTQDNKNIVFELIGWVPGGHVPSQLDPGYEEHGFRLIGRVDAQIEKRHPG